MYVRDRTRIDLTIGYCLITALMRCSRRTAPTSVEGPYFASLITEEYGRFSISLCQEPGGGDSKCISLPSPLIEPREANVIQYLRRSASRTITGMMRST